MGYDAFKEWYANYGTTGFIINSGDSFKNILNSYINSDMLEEHKNAVNKMINRYNDDFFGSNSLVVCFDIVPYSTVYSEMFCNITDNNAEINSREELYYPAPDSNISVMKVIEIKNPNIDKVIWNCVFAEYEENKEVISKNIINIERDDYYEKRVQQS